MSAKKSSADDSGMSRKERRAAERAARKGGKSPNSTSSGSRISVPMITGAAIVIGLLAVFALIAAGGGLGDEVQAVSEPEVAPPAAELRVGRSLGDPGAPVKIDVFEDPQCPACGLFTERIEPLLVAGPVTAGEVFMTYRDMAFLGPESVDAAAAMRVAEEMDGKFWEYHNVLFHNQSGENGGAFSTERLADMAVLVGLDRDEFLAELGDAQYSEAVDAETAEGRSLGVNSTPTLIIDGVLAPGVPDWDELRSRIDSAVAASGEGEEAG